MMQDVQHAHLAAAEQNQRYLGSPVPPPHQHQHPMPRVLLFNDSEEEVYNAENTTTLYHFDNEENSYPDMGDGSGESMTQGPGGYSRTGDYPKSYQSLVSYPSPSSCSGLSSVQHPLPSVVSVHHPPSTGIGDKSKYLTLSPSGPQSFKLEPISEMLSPIQSLSSYVGSQETHGVSHPQSIGPQPSQAWTSAQANTGAASAASASAASASVTNGGQFTGKPRATTSSLLTSSSTYAVMTNTTQDQLKEKCPAISSHMQSRHDEASTPYPKPHPKPDFAFSVGVGCDDPTDPTADLVSDKKSFGLNTFSEFPSCSGNLETLELAKSCSPLDVPPGSTSPQSSQDSFHSQDLCPLQPATTISGPLEPVVSQGSTLSQSSCDDASLNTCSQSVEGADIARQDDGLSASSSPTPSSSSLSSSSSSSSSSGSFAAQHQTGEESVSQNFGEIIKTSIVETVSA